MCIVGMSAITVDLDRHTNRGTLTMTTTATSSALVVRDGRTARRRYLPAKPRTRYVLAIPYTIPTDEVHDTPIGLLKRVAVEDFRETALVDLGLALAGDPHPTVLHGENPGIMVTCMVVVSSLEQRHVDARRAYLERGKDARTLADVTPRSLR